MKRPGFFPFPNQVQKQESVGFPANQNGVLLVDSFFLERKIKMTVLLTTTIKN